MGLVRTAEEIAAIQATLSAPRFPSAQMLSVSFLTRPEIVSRILPPPLEPADEPLVSAMVGRWRSNCVGDYDGGAIYVSATYDGIEGARQFMRDWLDPWEEWELEVETFEDAGDKVVAIVRQHGRSKATGLAVDMHFAMVFTVRDGKQVRMEMYADPAEALEAVGLRER